MFKEFDKNMKYQVTITRKDGTKTRYDLKSRTELSEVDEKREIITFFDNGQCFVGYCDGDVDDDEFSLRKNPEDTFSACLPYGRLFGWVYIDEGVNVKSIKSVFKSLLKGNKK